MPVRNVAILRLLAVAPLLGVVALAAGIRSLNLGDAQLFRDEATSWYLASQSPGDLLRLTSHETFPPLYVLLLKLWTAMFGDSEAALRSISVVGGCRDSNRHMALGP